MATKKVDGELFERMIKGGFNSLAALEKELNDMNVFPVSDGDTGTNMLYTLQNGIRCARATKNLSEYLEMLSGGMLLGARGNSGVILSQIFKGFYLELSRRPVAAASDIRNGFIRGYKVAYESVLHPAEGTILTVAREGIERASGQTKRLKDVESLLDAYITNMEISLENTPELLPVLKEAGVVDSGGKGYVAIIRGMAKSLRGEAEGGDFDALTPINPQNPPDFELFESTSAFEKGYCMEFILRLMETPGYDLSFSQSRFINALERLGTSIVIVRDGSKVKAHIHTFRPAPVIELAQRYGEFLSFKLENMQLQHNEHVRARTEEAAASGIPEAPVRERTPIAVIAAVNGEGNKQIFKDLGCELVLECGPTMNASAQEFLDAIESVNAEHCIILPGNPNLIPAAEQAARLTGVDVFVLPSKSIPESYFALAMDIQDKGDLTLRLSQMREGIAGIDTLLVAVAARDFGRGGLGFEKGSYVSIYKGEPVLSACSDTDAILGGLEKADAVEDRETIILFRGKAVPVERENTVKQALKARYPLHETVFLYGGQTVYDWMIGLC